MIGKAVRTTQRYLGEGMPWSEEYLDLLIQEEFAELKRTSRFNDWKFNIEKGVWVSPSFSSLAIKYGFPSIWVAGGNRFGTLVYFVGFWCGEDNDLICIAPLPYKETKDLDPYLSPEGRTPMNAIRKSIRKRIQLGFSG